MNTFKFDSTWNQIKGKLKQKYAHLTDDDLLFVEGKGQELLGRLQAKLGLTEDAVVALLHELKDSATNLSHGLQDKVSEATTRAGEVVGDVKAKVTAAAGDAYEHARQSAHTFQDKAESYVSQEPVKALLMALALGFVAGLVIRR